MKIKTKIQQRKVYHRSTKVLAKVLSLMRISHAVNQSPKRTCLWLKPVPIVAALSLKKICPQQITEQVKMRRIKKNNMKMMERLLMKQMT